MRADHDEDEGLDLDSRRLCPDDGCIGVLDESGRCKVCGRLDAGGSARAGEASVRPIAIEAEAGTGAGEEDPSGSPAGWEDRQLCPDGSCVGVIGSDGRCKVCGKSAE